MVTSELDHPSIAIAVSIGLVAVIGFSAHRAGICTVKAVAEIVTTRRAFMLASFARTALWVIAISTVAGRVSDLAMTDMHAWSVDMWAFTGGLFFGVGAAVNGACTISTLTGLGDGRLGFLATLLGVAAGMGALAALSGAGVAERAPMGEAGLSAVFQESDLLLTALVLWAGWESWRLWRGSARGASLPHGSGSVFRLSTSAALIGVANAVLFLLIGNWMFTGALSVAFGTGGGSEPVYLPLIWMLFVVLIASMGISAWQRGSFRLRRPGATELVQHLLGGLLMGVGAGMAPGGNAVLLLAYIPFFSPHGVPAYLSLILGIFVALAAIAALGFAVPRVSCAGDLCAMEATLPSPIAKRAD